MPTRARLVAVAIALAAITGLCGAASTVEAGQNLDWCNGHGDPSEDEVIRGCTAEIKEGNLDKENLAIALNSRGNAYVDKEQYDRAIEDYNHAIKVDPNEAMSFHNRGRAYDKKEQPDLAIADYTKVIELNPNAEAFHTRANVYQNQDQFDLAIKDYDEAIALNPNYAEAFNDRGFAYANKGQYDRAIQDYDHSIQLDPNDTTPFKNRADAYEQKNDYAHAALDYDEVTRIQPDDAEAWYSRCWARAIAGQLEQALKDCNESLRLKPDGNVAQQESRALTYLKLGQFDSAIADYDAAFKLDPKLATALYGRGIAKQKKGDLAGGDADLAAAKVIDADIAEVFARYRVQ